MGFQTFGWCRGLLLPMLLLPLPALADSPPLAIGAAGPVVQGFEATLNTTVGDSRRGLSIPVADIDFLQPGYNPNTRLDEFNAVFGTPEGITVNTATFGYRLFRTDEVVDAPVDGGFSVGVRVGPTGAVLATGTGATLQAARDAALASPALDPIRALIVASQQVALAATQTVVETLSSVVTGFDEYVAEGEVIFGRVGVTLVPVGFQGECASAFDDCAIVANATPGLNDTLIIVRTLRDISITDRIDRAITTVQNFVLNLTLDGDPPPITVGPTVETRYGTVTSTLLASERGLAIPFDDISELTPQIIINGVTEPFGSTYVPQSGTRVSPTDPFGQGVFYGETPFGYTTTIRTETQTIAVDGGVSLQSRIAGAGTFLATTVAATLQEAIDAALALPQVLAIDFASTATVAAGSTQTTTSTTTRMITGRDTYVSEGIVIFGADQVRIGNLGRCTTPVTDCEGGINFVFNQNDTTGIVYNVQDLYITETITDVVTTVQNYILNLILAGGDAAPHVGAQAVGLQDGDRFLARLARVAADRAAGGKAAGGGRRLSTKGSAGAAPPLLSFAEVSGVTGSFEQIGTIEDSDWSSQAITAGIALPVGADLTLGLAIELGEWRWRGDGARVAGDTQKFGLLAAWQRGPWSISAEGFAGQQEVETRDALGVTSEYDADLCGLGVAAEYTLAAGGWRLAPSVALRWVQWSAPAVTDSAGGAFGAVRIDQWRPEIGLKAGRRFAMARGVLDLGVEARAWTVEGARAGIAAAGLLTEGPSTGKGGSLGLRADWSMAENAVLSAGVATRFGEEGSATSGDIGVRIRF